MVRNVSKVMCYVHVGSALKFKEIFLREYKTHPILFRVKMSNKVACFNREILWYISNYYLNCDCSSEESIQQIRASASSGATESFVVNIGGNKYKLWANIHFVSYEIYLWEMFLNCKFIKTYFYLSSKSRFKNIINRVG